MADFTHISIPELRECLENDYRELRACLAADAWKAVHVLAGSIVEAVLIDALNATTEDQGKLEKMEFGNLIGLAKEKGILPDEAVDLSTVIRKYRNLIHPGRLKRLEKKVERSGAIVAAEVVEIVTKEAARRKQETYGFTAEQLLARLRGGPSALPLLTYLLNETPHAEIERLLIDVLPQAYFLSVTSVDTTVDEDQHLKTCYREVFEAAPDASKAKVMKNLVSIYKTKPEPTVLLYEDGFLRGYDLEYLSASERELIKAHFLPRLDDDEELEQRLYTLRGFGSFLTASEARDVSATLLLAMHGGEEPEVSKAARTALLLEYRRMSSECRAVVLESAGAYPATFKRLEQEQARLEAELHMQQAAG